MNSNFKLLSAALLVAVLALAGCGGGSNTTPDPDPMPTPTPPPPPSGNEQVDQSGKAVEAALAARTAALKAETDGETAAKGLTTRAVKGNSAMAAMNAQAIIDAAAEVEKQIMAAENAVAMIEAAIAALPDDTVNRAGVLASLNDDLMSAKGYLADINDQVDLEGELYMVRGQLDEGMPSDFSTDVADAIQSAFNAETDTSAVANWWLSDVAADNRVAHTSAAGTTPAERAERLKYGVSASTAPDSFKPLSLTGGALNLTGALLSQFTDRGTDTGEDGVLVAPELEGIAADGATSARAVTYKGLMGNLTCATAAECGSEGGALTGPWSLAMDPSTRTTDSDPNALYRLVEGKYVAFEGGYVTYGYWLGGTDDAPNINTFAIPSGYGDFVGATVTVGEAAGPLTASYDGHASGIAVIRTVNPDDANDVTSRRSGAFTADVSLSADFSGAEPELRGEVDTFAGGVADPTWRVELRPANVNATGGLAETAAAVGFRGTSEADTEGRWSAQMAGGAAGARPTAVYGGFGAYFPNGEAVGAYQAD